MRTFESALDFDPIIMILCAIYVAGKVEELYVNPARIKLSDGFVSGHPHQVIEWIKEDSILAQ